MKRNTLPPTVDRSNKWNKCNKVSERW